MHKSTEQGSSGPALADESRMTATTAVTPEPKVVSDTDVLRAVAKMLEGRIPTMRDEGLARLLAECSAEDRARLEAHPHLREGTTERWAWHAGYITAMADALRMIKNREPSYPIKDQG